MAIIYTNGRIVYGEGQTRVELTGIYTPAVNLADWLDRGYLSGIEQQKLTGCQIYSSLMNSKDPNLVGFFINALKLTGRDNFEGLSRLGVLEEIAKRWGENESIKVLISKTQDFLKRRIASEGVKPGVEFIPLRGNRLKNRKITPE